MIFEWFSKEQKDRMKQELLNEIKNIPPSVAQKIVEKLIKEETWGVVLKRALQKVKDLKKEYDL